MYNHYVKIALNTDLLKKRKTFENDVEAFCKHYNLDVEAFLDVINLNLNTPISSICKVCYALNINIGDFILMYGYNEGEKHKVNFNKPNIIQTK